MTTASTTSAADVKKAACANPGMLDQIAGELVKNGSIELSGLNPRAIAAARDCLPYGTNIYVPALPGRSILDILDRLRQIREAGFDPVPHIAARRIQSSQQLRQFLRQAVEQSGVHRVLLIGGDTNDISGPYVDSLDLLRDGVIQQAGVREVGFAGYPEGHPRIPSPVIQEALEKKLELAAATGLGCYMITQFSFAPTRIVDYCAAIARTYPELPVYVGMAGPTSTVQLLKYAKLCGVSASLRSLVAMGFKAARLVTHTDPGDQLTALVRYCASHESGNVIGIHLFSFGGFSKSAFWMQKLLNGNS